MAIDAGYRHIDGALVYYNEHEVGQAMRERIADGSVKRDDIFYCGKVCDNLCLILSIQETPGLQRELLCNNNHLLFHHTVMEHIPQPRIGSTHFGENTEDIADGLC